MGYDKLVDSAQLDADLTSIADAIREKSGGSSSLPFPVGFVSEVKNIENANQGDVNFYDYDGSIFCSYTKDEFLALQSMPQNPHHKGLIAQGWNWPFDEAQEYVETYGVLDVGQNYITDDGKSRFYIYIPDAINNGVSLLFTQTVDGGTVIDWGDGSSESASGTGNITMSHTYISTGTYTITLTVEDGCVVWFGHSNKAITCDADGNMTESSSCRVLKIEIGRNVIGLNIQAFYGFRGVRSISIPVSLTNYSGYSHFAFCTALKTIVLPIGVTSTGSYTVYGCWGMVALPLPYGMTYLSTHFGHEVYSLARICVPSTVTWFSSQYTFFGARAMVKVVLPSGLTNITGQCFYNCYALSYITIPDTVTSIASQAFYNCTNMKVVRLLSTTPPVLESTDVFTNVPSDCIIYVPSSADHSVLTAYQEATNWSTYASYMQEEPQS